MPAPRSRSPRRRPRAASCSAARDLGGEVGRRRLLDHLLVAALDRAVALAEHQDVAVPVADDLHLDVAAALDVRLDEDGAVAERAGRLGARAPRSRRRASARSRTIRMPRPPPPADAFTSSGQVGLGRARPGASSTGTPASRMIRFASILEPIASIDSGVGPDPGQPGGLDGPGEVGVLGQEAVAGVDRVGAGPPRRVAARRRRRGRSRPARCRAAGRRRRPRGRTAAPASASEWTATVSMPSARQVRNTRRAISARLATSSRVIMAGTPRTARRRRTGVVSMTDRQMPSTVRVSRGSMTPSS